MVTDYSQILDLLWSELKTMIYSNVTNVDVEINNNRLCNYTDLIVNLEKLKFKVQELKDIKKCL